MGEDLPKFAIAIVIAIVAALSLGALHLVYLYCNSVTLNDFPEVKNRPQPAYVDVMKAPHHQLLPGQPSSCLCPSSLSAWPRKSARSLPAVFQLRPRQLATCQRHGTQLQKQLQGLRGARSMLAGELGGTLPGPFSLHNLQVAGLYRGEGGAEIFKSQCA